MFAADREVQNAGGLPPAVMIMLTVDGGVTGHRPLANLSWNGTTTGASRVCSRSGSALTLASHALAAVARA